MSVSTKKASFSDRNVFNRLGRAGAESRLDRVAVDVRILDDQVAPWADQPGVNAELLEYVLRIVGRIQEHHHGR